MKKKLPSSKKAITKKQQEEQNRIDYEKMLAKWANVPKFSQRKVGPPPETKLTLNLGVPSGRESPPKIPSVVTPGAWTSTKESQQYTGTKMLGVGQMHKSNAVPIFNHEAAEDVAKMRRN